MSLLAFIIVGMIAGWLAALITRGGGLGIIGDIVVGIIGAIVGGYLLGALGVSTGDDWLGWIITATIGAVVVLFLINLVAGGPRGRGRLMRG